MAEALQDRTEEATPRRRQQAHDEGRVPRSQDLLAGATLLAAGLAIGPVAPRLVDAAARTTAASFQSGHLALQDPAAAVDWLRWVGVAATAGFLPFAVAVSGVALLVGAGQARGTWSTTPIEPKWSRVSPMENLKRFFSVQPFVDLLKSTLKLLIVGLVVYSALAGALEELSRLPQSGPLALVDVLRSQVTRVLIAAGLSLLALAAFDYGYQAWRHQRDLRMTKDEVRRELREAEGDPLVRARLRSLGRALARSRMMSAVPTADVVVTNPTHIAVALRYDAQESDAPVVVAMGTRKLAERIRRIALESGVPVIENRPVARALFATTKVGRPIPPALYYAVAEILAFVYRRRRGMADVETHA